MSDRQKLATYQAKLLDALHAAKTLEEAEAALQSLAADADMTCLLYTSPSPRDATLSRMPSSA